MPSTTGSLTPKPNSNFPDSAEDYAVQLYHSSQDLPPNTFPSKATDHVYFSYAAIHTSEVMIGIPDAYFDDQARGHALYISGAPASLNGEQFERIVTKYGEVKKAIAVIDLKSEQTFRWVVMWDFRGARTVLDGLQGERFGSEIMEVCYALSPGAVVALRGRSVREMYAVQMRELFWYNFRFREAVMERERGTGAEDAVWELWHDELISASVADKVEGSTAESLLVLSLEDENLNQVRRMQGVTYSQVDVNNLPEDKGEAVKADDPSSRSWAVHRTESPEIVRVPTAKKLKPQSIGPALPRPPAVLPAIPAVIAKPIAPAVPAPVPVVPASSWANIAAPVTPANNKTSHLTIDLHPENKPSSTAPRLTAPVNPNVIAHAQGETPEEQLRVVFLFNLPTNITLSEVSNAVSEGPLLNIKFATDTDNGNRYAGIIFQYAWDAERFYGVLLQEKADSRPGRFRFIVDAGRDTPYPYDEELALMDEPTYACRRLTIVKKGFFFQFSKRQLRQLCEKLVGAEKIQTIWLYNGGNGTVIFSDVRSAVTVKAELDRLSLGIGKGNMMAVFAELQTTFSKDPCAAELKFQTDIDDLNAD